MNKVIAFIFTTFVAVGMTFPTAAFAKTIESAGAQVIADTPTQKVKVDTSAEADAKDHKIDAGEDAKEEKAKVDVEPREDIQRGRTRSMLKEKFRAAQNGESKKQVNTVAQAQVQPLVAAQQQTLDVSGLNTSPLAYAQAEEIRLPLNVYGGPDAPNVNQQNQNNQNNNSGSRKSGSRKRAKKTTPSTTTTTTVTTQTRTNQNMGQVVFVPSELQKSTGQATRATGVTKKVSDLTFTDDTDHNFAGTTFSNNNRLGASAGNSGAALPLILSLILMGLIAAIAMITRKAAKMRAEMNPQMNYYAYPQY